METVRDDSRWPSRCRSTTESRAPGVRPGRTCREFSISYTTSHDFESFSLCLFTHSHTLFLSFTFSVTIDSPARCFSLARPIARFFRMWYTYIYTYICIFILQTLLIRIYIVHIYLYVCWYPYIVYVQLTDLASVSRNVRSRTFCFLSSIVCNNRAESVDLKTCMPRRSYNCDLWHRSARWKSASGASFDSLLQNSYIHAYTRSYTCIHTYIHAYIHAYTYTNIHTCMHTHVQTFVHHTRTQRHKLCRCPSLPPNSPLSLGFSNSLSVCLSVCLFLLSSLRDTLAEKLVFGLVSNWLPRN